MNRIISLKNQLEQRNTSSDQKVIVEKLQKEQIGVITLNSPKDLNCLSKTMRKAICDAVTQFDTDDSTKVIVIMSNNEKVFCAGADIKEIQNITQESQYYADIFHELRTVMSNTRKPLIAAVNGFAFGGGCELALICDTIICSEKAVFSLPELNLGLIPGLGGTVRLAKLIGRTNAIYHVLTSEQISAQKAQQLGLVAQLYQAPNCAELRVKALECAKLMASKSMYCLISAKAAIKQAEEVGLTQGQFMEAKLFDALQNLQAKKHGVEAFVAKKKPDFSNM